MICVGRLHDNGELLELAAAVDGLGAGNGRAGKGDVAQATITRG